MKLTLNASPPVARLRQEAEAMGVSFPALLTADLVRYRDMARAAVPEFGAWEWDLLAHVLSGIEAHRILTGDDSLMSAIGIAAAIDEWADDASDEETLRAGRLRAAVANLPPLAVAGILMRLRDG